MARIRIKDYRLVPAKDIQPNPRNWRRHPIDQVEAMRGNLDELGQVNAVIAFEAGDGKLMLIDGHLRKDVLADELVPVLVTDLDEAEADRAMLTLDPLAAMAGRDSEKLKALIASVHTSSEAVQRLISSLIPYDDFNWSSHLLERAEQAQRKWQTVEGQVWKVRSQTVPTQTHYLAIGDSTNPQVAQRIAARLDIVVTDPPYEMDAGMVREGIGNLAPRAVVLTSQHQAFSLCRDGWEHNLDLVWRRRVPRSAAPSRNYPIYYHQVVVAMQKLDPAEAQALQEAVDVLDLPTEEHRTVLMLTKRARLGWRRPTRDYGSVIEVAGAEYIDQEGYWKNPQVFVEMMRGFLWLRWGDPFFGTGTSLLAAESLGRTMYGIELSPGIMALALERASLAGLRPERVD